MVRPKKWIQPAGAWVSYYVIRTITVAAILYFTRGLLSGLPLAHPFGVLDRWPTPWQFANEGVWLAVPLLLSKLMWEVFARNTGPIARAGLVLRWGFGALFPIVLVGIAWNYSTADPPGAADALGYLIGLVASILGWRLHTKLHKGLFQMWKYTRGWKEKDDEGTSARENEQAYRSPKTSKSATA